jgi:hypothetical protein
MLNKVAVVAINGWYGNKIATSPDDDEYLEILRMSDISYLTTTIRKLQEVDDVDKVIIISNSIPSEYLSLNSEKARYPEKIGPAVSLIFDSQAKVSNWLFGSDMITIDTVIKSRSYVNNPKCNKNPYWPKRVEI